MSERSDEYDKEHIIKQKKKRKPLRAISPSQTIDRDQDNRDTKNRKNRAKKNRDQEGDDDAGIGSWFISIFGNSCCAAKDPSIKNQKKIDNKEPKKENVSEENGRRDLLEESNTNSLSLKGKLNRKNRLTANTKLND